MQIENNLTLSKAVKSLETREDTVEMQKKEALRHLKLENISVFLSEKDLKNKNFFKDQDNDISSYGAHQGLISFATDEDYMNNGFRLLSDTKKNRELLEKAGFKFKAGKGVVQPYPEDFHSQEGIASKHLIKIKQDGIKAVKEEEIEVRNLDKKYMTKEAFEERYGKL